MCYTDKLSDLVINEMISRRKIEDMKSIDTMGTSNVSFIEVAK